MNAALASTDSLRTFRQPWLAGLLCLALLLRLFALFLAWGIEPAGDPENYLLLANSLQAGEGLVLPSPVFGPGPAATALFPPLLPLLLAAVGFVAPLNAVTICLFNTIIDCIAAWLLVRLARLIGVPQIGVPAAVAYLLWPSIALMSPLAYKEGLVIALILGTLVTLFEQASRSGLRWAVASGLCAGALLLTQPALAALLPLLFLAGASKFPNWKRWWQVSIVAAAVAILVMLPWWLRNALVFGTFIPLTSSGGLALWEGAHPSGGVVWKPPPKEWTQLTELAAAQVASAEAWRVILADPMGYLGRCLAKFPSSFFYSNWAVDQLVYAKGQRWPWLGQSTLLRLGPTILELWAVAMAGVGLIRLRNQLAARLLWACIAQVMLFGIWFEFSERHRLFMTPFILLLACQLLLASRHRAPR